VGTGVVQSSGNAAADRAAADYRAFAEIANQILTLIHSDLSLQQIEIVADQSNSLSGALKASVRLSSSLELSGLTIVERFYDPEQRLLYSLAVLDLEAATAPLKAKLSELNRSYESSFESAHHLCRGGAIAFCFAELTRAYESARSVQEIVPYYRLLRARVPGGLTERDEPSVDALVEFAARTLAGLRLERVDGDGQQGLVGQPLRNPLRVRVFAADGDRVPARGLSVRFEFQEGRGDVTETSVTDSAGIAEGSVHRLERTPTGSYLIAASLDLGPALENLPADWKSLIVRPPVQTVVFRVTLRRAPAAFKVLVFMEQREMAELVSAELVRAGFTSVSDADVDRALSARVRRVLSANQYEQLARAVGGSADLVAFGTVDASPVGEYQGVRVFEARGWVKVVRISDGLSLAEDVVRDVRGFGADDEQARQNALRAGAQQLAESVVAQLLTRM